MPDVQATYDVRVAWETNPIGAFVIGLSLIGGSDVISDGVSFNFDGANDDLSALVRSLNWQRGSNDLLTASNPGEATITINDPDGIYNPQNPASPLAGLLVPMRPVRIKATTDVATVNLITNPSFEVDLTGWTLLTGSTIHQDTSDHVFGSACLRVDTSTSVGSGVFNSGGPTLTSGATYTASVRVKAPAGASMQMSVTRSGGFSAPGFVAPAWTADGTWQTISAPITPDVTTAWRIVLQHNSASAISFYVDGAQFEEGATATEYCDGDQPGCEWTGTANASTSERVGFGVFRGFIQEIVHTPDHRWATTTFQCIDAVSVISQAKPVIASTGPITVGAALALIHGAVGLLASTDYDYDDGDTLPDFSADGSKTALQIVTDLLAVALGRYFVAGSGAATYADRHARAFHTSPDATFAANVRALSSGTSLNTVKNKATVTRTGGTPQTAKDAESVRTYGERPYSDLDSDYLSDDTQALGLANFLVALTKDPKSPMWSLEVKPRDLATLATCLGLEIGDRISVDPAGTSSSGDFNLEQISATATPASTGFSFVLSQRLPTDDAFLIGVSEVGGTDLIVY